jgi:hypothetical protein
MDVRPNYRGIEAKSEIRNRANTASKNNLVSMGQDWLVTTP